MAKSPQRLFSHNPPPQGDRFAHELFVDREHELAMGVQFLTAGEDFEPRIYAVHGESRSGKSHLARRLLDEVADRFTLVELNATTMGDARQALIKIFSDLYAAARGLASTGDHPDRAEQVEPWLGWFKGVLPLIQGHETSRTFEVERGVRDVLTQRYGSVRIGFIEMVGEAIDREATTVTVERPDDWMLVGLVGQLADLAWYAGGGRPVLIYVDDLDLLTRRRHREDDPEAVNLTAFLEPIAESPRVVVVASVRSRYFTTRDKAFHDFLKVRLFSRQRLAEVYQRQIDVLHDGEPVFSDEALDRLLAVAAGRVGVFLRFCYQLWRFAWGQLPIGRERYDAWVEQELRELMSDPRTAKAMQTVGSWVASGEVGGSLPGVDPEDGPLAGIVLRPPSLGADGRVEVVPEHRAVIKRLVIAAEAI